MEEIISAQLIENILHNINLPANLKDAKSGKYLDTNHAYLHLFGMTSPTEMIGKTIWDLNAFMHSLCLDHVLQMAEFEREVYQTGKAAKQKNLVWLNAHGMVWVHNTSKIPVNNTPNQISAILSLNEDLTKTLSLEELYNHYCIFYPESKPRVSKFLEHIGVLNHFATLPTHAEVIVLIAKKMLVHNKLVAQKLNIQLGTVESHINRLGQKTKNLRLALSMMAIQ